MSGCLRRAGLRYLLRHPWQTWMSLLGIALGVAVLVAVDLANQSAARSFERSMEQLLGRSSHQILANAGRIPEAFYAEPDADFDALALPRKAISYGDNLVGFFWKLAMKDQPKGEAVILQPIRGG